MYKHPTADVADSAVIGEGTRIWHEAQVRPRVRIGRDCILGKGAYLDEDVVIGDRVKIQNRASIYRECLIEDGVFIGPHVVFTNDRTPRAINTDGSLKDADDWSAGSTVVRTGASIGAGAIILPGLTIGRYAMVGAGTVVTKDVPDHGLVVGNPGRLVGSVCACGVKTPLGEHMCESCRVDLPAEAMASAGAANERQENTMMTVAVVGLGKVGLPLAVQYASHGARVIGCDINPTVVEMVNRGESPIIGEAHLEERLAEAHGRGLITATTDTASGARQADVVVVIVPMMIGPDHSVDYRAIDAATEAIGAGLRPGTLVVYETTLPVGTTRNRFGAILERSSGLRPGADFGLAFSPERIRTGRIFRDLATYPKVVGGIDPASTAQAESFYRTVLDAPVMTVRDAETAELTKLMETAYRDVNIALANEFAVYAASRGIDMREAAAAANSQPQSDIHEPGVGVGGHCIPVYPYFLLQDATEGELQLSRAARQINDGMATYAVTEFEQYLGDLTGRRVLIMGVTYRANVKEVAFSSALRLKRTLEARGAEVVMHDPLLSDVEIESLGGTPVSLENLGSVDGIVIQATHESYRALPSDFYRQARVVLDGRGEINPDALDLGETVWLRIGTPPVAGSTPQQMDALRAIAD